MDQLTDFFAHLGCKNPATLVKALDEHDIHSLDDLGHLDQADRNELADELKASGFSIGDRGKVKRATRDEIAAFKDNNNPSVAASPRISASQAQHHRVLPATPPGATESGVSGHHRQSIIELPTHMNTDEFSHLEKTILGLVNDPVSANKLWKDLDSNGNGIVSMAELDKFLKVYYPQLANSKAIIRAHHRATRLDGDGDEWIQRNELEMLMVNLFYYNKLLLIFNKIDSSGDGRVDFEEFVQGLSLIGFGITREQAWKEFCKMDDDRGGLILFDEFCNYVTAKMWPNGFEAYYKSREDIGESARQRNPEYKVHGKIKGKKGLDKEPDIHTTKYDALELEVLAQCSSKAKAKELFRSIDDNNSGKISQKEFTVWIKKAYPSLTDNEAIKFAFKKTIRESEDGDKFVQPDEFKELFINLFYYAKLKFVFNKIDKNHDKKISFQEFAKGLMWVGLTMDTNDALKEFDDIDARGGGNGELDFGEFCSWVARKKIPVD